MGASGTGKTVAGEVIANELGLDFYRVDLSQVVSKYIGKTGKKLHWVFDAAEDGGMILFFDEADPLFGKRTEIRDVHHRFANMDTSYLLQVIENYQWMAFLAANKKENMDTAFIHRLSYALEFMRPEAVQR